MAEVTFLQNSLLTKFVYPFLLMFFILFAVLEKTKVFGSGTKQINALISFVISFIFVSAVFPKEVTSNLMLFLDLRQHRSKDFETEILFISQSVGASLNHPDFIVEAFDEAQRNLVLREAVRGKSFPVPVDHFGEFLEGLQILPLEGCTPVLEELPGPGFAAVLPELAEGLFERVSRLQPLIGLMQRSQGLLAVQGEILPVRQLRVSLPLDKLAILAFQSGVLAAAHLIHCLAEVAQRVELVVQGRWVNYPVSGQYGQQ